MPTSARQFVDGSTAQLTGGNANWSLNVTKPSTATITIKDSTGQNVYTGTVAVNPGTQSFTWNGRGNDGRLWPDGAYTLTATAVDTNKQSVAISDVQAIVDSVDLTQEPPSCRSMDRTTRSTRSSGLSGRPHDRGMARCEVLAFNYYRLLTRSAS
ncbi:MAG: FlgD immunoglobulin-like domain containing protein [Pseudolabrys sp.]